MSMESARLFVQEVQKNRDFANNVRKIEDQSQLLDFAKKTGFEFSANELKEANTEAKKLVDRELDETELSMVIGGSTTMFPPCTPTSTAERCKGGTWG